MTNARRFRVTVTVHNSGLVYRLNFYKTSKMCSARSRMAHLLTTVG